MDPEFHQVQIYSNEVERKKSGRENVWENTNLLDNIPQYPAAHTALVQGIQSLPYNQARELYWINVGKSGSGKSTVRRLESYRLINSPEVEEVERVTQENVYIGEFNYADASIIAQMQGKIPPGAIDEHGKPVYRTRLYTKDEGDIITNTAWTIIQKGILSLHNAIKNRHGTAGYVILNFEASQVNMIRQHGKPLNGWKRIVQSNWEYIEYDDGLTEAVETGIDIQQDKGDSVIYRLATDPAIRPNFYIWWTERDESTEEKTVNFRRSLRNPALKTEAILNRVVNPYLHVGPEVELNREKDKLTVKDFEKLRGLYQRRVGSAEATVNNDLMLYESMLMASKTGNMPVRRSELGLYEFDDSYYFDYVAQSILKLRDKNQFHFLQNYGYSENVKDFLKRNEKIVNLAALIYPQYERYIYI